MGFGLRLRWARVFKRNLLPEEGQVEEGQVGARHADGEGGVGRSAPSLIWRFSLNSVLVKGQCNLYFA